MKLCDRYVSRRQFLETAGIAVAACAVCRDILATESADATLHEADFYEKLAGGSVRCRLCPWQCTVPDGKRGRCRVRENRSGKYYSLVWGRPCLTHNDPIEKKPFFHVYPGTRAFSIATVGCNIECKFCQNWDISQASPEDVSAPFKSPEEIVRLALAQKVKTIAYTYSEPVVFTEYILDCAKAAKEAGLGNVIVSNGFLNEKPLKEWCSVATAIKIDFKGFSQKFYEETCAGQLQPVLDTLKRLAGSGVWFEIVVLIIPPLNDDLDEIKRMTAWIVKDLGPNVPLHFTRFHPDYKLRNLPPTPINTLIKARQIAMDQGCNFVYVGNMPGVEGENTYCPKCKAAVVKRYGMGVLSNDLKNGKCPGCGTAIPGVWV
ncbi:MAG: AmmeMemoRadiSam system radical SAM enzyme [Kiritimatiellae bacterium]|nr:AmmeMemoRadiSam system radical SAM enzyme [Verrucomicrobiota bacterium]MBU4286057.1 AmmeMemoRadiSam system radical SAM enzyme [Verrucomicrobiota bacterium]MBU4366608.1 AmmeMemoRadiSam system radical SAM enzyme [Verrucomicrobiota bacterium]MCG2661392.1 AmmeMemoRadiSam system radical SAM enzyme [Kiritimatiellia bacterium]